MKKRNLKKPVISALEQRVLFDGAAVETAVDVLDNSSFSSTTNDATNNSAENIVHEAQAVQSFERPRREVAFVDVTVSDYQTLVDGVGEGVETYLVSSMNEISSILKNETNIDAIHILSHGNTGEIIVGNDVLNQSTLNNFDAVLQSMKSSLGENGDILLYGCNVASDGTGQEFIDLLSSETQADVAASNDVTGNSNVNGDWDLEIETGSIETSTIVVENYSSRLADVKYTENDSATLVANNVTISSGTNFSGGYVEFSLSGSTSTETLSLVKASTASIVNGQISIVGNGVYIGNGSVAVLVGSIDNTYNGENGQKLRINFSNTFTNRNFTDTTATQTGTVVDISGWTVYLQQLMLGQNGVAGTSTIDGWATPIDSTPTPSNPNNPSQVSRGDDYTPSGAVYSYAFEDGGLRLYSSGMTTAAGGDIVHGPYVVSDSTVTLSSGDSVSFDWKAQGGDDAYDIYAYLLNVDTGATVELLNQTGVGRSATAWATKNTNINTAGTYKFVFVSGTFDETFGQAAGASLYIDNIVVTQAVMPPAISGSVLQYITRNLTYYNSSETLNTLGETKNISINGITSGGVTDVSLSRSIEIIGVNDLPYILGKETVTVNEDTSITISGLTVGDKDIGSGNLTVTIDASHGTLSLGNSTGVTTSWDAVNKTFQITGTVTNLNNALATLRYQGDANWFSDDPLTITINDNQGSGEQPYRINQTGKFFNPDNGHYYEFVSSSGITWDQAKIDAESRTLYGLNGYLVTITSDSENTLITSMAGGNGWIGASDADSEGIWKWVTGPEAGTQFWLGDTNAGTSSTLNYGSSYNNQYANWASGEPNNSDSTRGGEDVAHFYYSGTNAGKWNDFAANNTSAIAGYIVEYGGAGGTLTAANLTVRVLSVNDLPVNNNVPSSKTTTEDTAIVFSTANKNAITISDNDALNDSSVILTTTLSIGSGKGTLTLTEGSGATITNNGSTTVQITGTVSQINASLEGLTYSPTLNANGTAYTTLTITTNDGVSTDTDSITIDITPVDDKPVANAMAATVGPNSKQSFDQFQPNFTDVDNNVMTEAYQLEIISLPTVGKFQVYDGSGDKADDSNWIDISDISTLTKASGYTLQNGRLVISMANLNNYRFDAGDNSGQSTNVNWRVMTIGDTNDLTGWSNTATGVVTILDSSSNDAPVVNIYNGNDLLNNGSITITEDSSANSIKLIFSDYFTPEEYIQGIVSSSNTNLLDMSGISMIRSTTNSPGDTVTFTFTPKANMYGSTVITLGASDGDKTTTQSFTLNVTSVNEQAIVDNFTRTINEDTSFSFATINPADIYHDANDVNNNANVSAVDYNAQMAIIQDAMMNPSNTNKQAAKITAIKTLVEANYFPQSFIIDTLPTKGDLYLDRIKIESTNYTIAIANLEKLVYQPDLNYFGTDSFTWHALDKDDLATTTKTATFSVNSINDAPTISVSTPSGFTESTDINNQTLTQSGTVTFNDIDNNVNITYNYNNDISWSGRTLDSAVSAVSAALISGFSTGATNVSSGTTTWNYNVNNIDLNFLAQGETITLSYMVTVTDLSGVTDTETISFIITGTNDGPVFGTISTGNSDIVTAPTTGTTNPNAGIETFNNGLLRFGNGSIDSVNASTGMLEQPWYYKDGTWYKLTYSSYQLNMAIAADYNSGSSETDTDWNLEGTVNLTPTFTNTTVDNSGFNSSTGTGTIIWTGKIVVGSAHLKVTNVYTLEAGAKYIKANTYIENIGSTSTENLRFWVGTRDDFVAGSDSPAKQKGNIVDGEFEIIPNSAEQAKAIKIFTGTGANATAVLFYSTNENVNTVIAPGYGWSTSNQYAPGIDPLNSVYKQSYDDGGYAMFTNLNNVAAGQTVMFDWYYAAGAVSELSDITSSLEQATSTNLQENSTSLVLADNYTITDLDLTDSVNVTVSSVQITTPTGLTLPSEYTNDIIKNMLQITSNPVIGNSSTTGTVSWNFYSGTDYTFNFLGRGQTLTLLYTLTATDSHQRAIATTTVTISIDGVNDTPTVIVDSGDSDSSNISETNSTLSSNGTLGITDVDLADTNFSVSKSSVVTSGMTNGLNVNTAALLNMLTVTTEDFDINWGFNSGNEYFDYLSAGETLTLTYTIAVSDSNNAVTNKTITINITGTNDTVSLNAPATIYYTDTDGNDVFSATSSQLSANDIDRNTIFTYGIENGTISGTTVTKTGTYGILTLNTTTGVYTYTPNSNAINALTLNSSETFVVTVDDGNGSIDNKNLVIEIESVNDAPLLGGNSIPNTFVENGNSVQVDSNITITDLEGTSYDEGYLSFNIIANKESLDDLSIASIGGISLDGTNVKYGNTIIGTVDAILNGQDGKELRIHLNENAYSSQVQALARAITFSNSSDDFDATARAVEIKVNDGGNGGETTARYNTKTVTVNLQSVNDLPTINLGNSTFLVEKVIGQNDNGTLSLGNILSVADLDSDTLTVTIETTNYGLITINYSITNGLSASQISGNGSRIVTITGTIEQINNTLNASNGVTYIAGFGNDYITPGADYLKITAGDELNGITTSQKLVMVLPAIPNIFSDNVIGQEDDSSTIIININDLVTDINNNGGTYVFGTGTPDITNSSGTITTTRSLTAFNSRTYIYDNSGKVIGYQLEHGKIMLNERKNRTDDTDFAKFTFIPNENWYGVQTFLYQFTSNDGEVSNIAQIAIFVTPENDTPVITVVNSNITIDEDNAFVFENGNSITLADLDVIDNTQILDLTLNVNNGKLELSQMTDLTVLEGENNSSIIKVRGSLNSLQNAISGLKYTPNLDYNGSDTLTIKLNDNGNIGEGNSLEDIRTVNFTINAINDAPVFTNQVDRVIEGNQIFGVLPASDVDSSSIRFSVNGNAPAGFILNDNGSFSFDSSSYNYIGHGETDTIIIPITVTDAEGLTKIANFSITVTGTNDAPTVSFENIDSKIPFGEVYNKDISSLFSDKDLTDNFRFEATNLPLGLTIDSNTGIISGRVAQSGNFVIVIKGIDSQGASVTRTYNMLVIAPAQIAEPTNPTTPTIPTNSDTNTNNSTDGLNNFTDNNSSNLGVLNFNSNDGLSVDTGIGFLGTEVPQNNPTDGTNDNTPTTNTSNPNDSKGVLQASVDLNVLTNGQVVFNEGNQDSFSIVGITIEDIKVENNFIEIKVVDTNLSQNFIVTQTDGTPLPAGLFFDPKTGNITGTIPEDLEKIDISIKAINQDGTTRVLNLKLDLKELKNKNQANQADADEKYMGLKEQIAMENQKLDGYGSYLTRLFA